MDLSTVGAVVEALVATYAAGLDYYTGWQHRKWQENHYETRNEGGPGRPNACALSTSLEFSGRKIREAFDSGVDMFGNGFSTGDEICREKLQDSLERLQECVYNLRKETRTKNGPIGVFEAICTSESVRVSCLVALAGQYRRVAVGRLVPQALPGKQQQQQQQQRTSVITSEADTIKPAPRDVGGVTEDTPDRARHALVEHRGGSPKKSPYLQSEPPSPPPTPEQIPEDLQSICTSSTSTTSGHGLRPKNSVFSMFCPNALEYQVNPHKVTPKRRNCRCGYDWNGPHTRDEAAMTVNEGFRITTRFLGKSHCEGGFGCVLCTSSGRTGTYASVEALRDHINASHTKWQLLHDRDMSIQCIGAG